MGALHVGASRAMAYQRLDASSQILAWHFNSVVARISTSGGNKKSYAQAREPVPQLS